MLLGLLAACTTDPEDTGGERPPPAYTVVPLPAGASYDTVIDATAEAGATLGVRVTWNPQVPARYDDGRPVVVIARGSLGAGSFLDTGTMAAWQAAGFVVVEVILPGGNVDGVASTGTFDTRGPLAQSALVDVVHYATGAAVDTAGAPLTAHVPDALGWVGIAGMSNGVNLAFAALARRAAEVEGVKWVVAWEGPYTDQFLDVELQSYEFKLNPAYELGSCEDTACPMPALAEMLQFDPSAQGFTNMPLQGTEVTLPGILYIDEDGSGAYESPEYWWYMVATEGDDGKYVVTPSIELAEVIDAESERLFPDGARPRWLPSTSWLRTFWADRDCSLVLPDLAAARPDLAIVVAASEEDHIYLGVPDNPHVTALTHHLQGLGFDFVRLNPDAAYLAALSGAPVDKLPDNDAGTSPTWPDTPAWLEPELRDSLADRTTAAAAGLELADRVHDGVWLPNLDGPLYPRP